MGLSIGKDIVVNNDGRENLNILWHKEDRQPNVVHGHRIDNPKIKVVKIGMQTPEVPTGYIELKQDSKKPVEFEMKSFTRNYYNRITDWHMCLPANYYGTTGGAGYLNARLTSGSWGTGTSVYDLYDGVEIHTFENSGNTQGILVGSSSSDFSFEDYALSVYTDGYAAGNLYHIGNTPFVKTVSGEDWTINHSAFFDNFSGGSITNINEVGLISQHTSSNYLMLNERSVLAVPITLLNKEGLRVRYQRTFTIPPVNWTRNFYNAWLIGAGMSASTTITSFGQGYISIRDTNLANANPGSKWNSSNGLACAAATSNRGIIVGTDSTEETLDDRALVAKVIHSAAFYYDATLRLGATYTAGTLTHLEQLSRTVNNISSGDTTIAEIGLVMYIHRDYQSFTDYYVNVLMARKVLASPVTLTNGESIQVIYEISSVFPA